MKDPSFPGSSSSGSTWKYDVFLNFRGEDTRNSFISHLYAALHRNGIFTYMDARLQKGDAISSALLNAIEQSRISIVVFSKNYADSSWCLDELVKILDATKVRGQTVMPIFYDVKPSDVQKQSGNFKKAFDKHVMSLSDNNKVQRWRLALTYVANLCGYDVGARSEPDIIDEIVTDVRHELGHRFSSLADGLVGIQPRAEAVEKLLDLKSDDVRMIGIYGMGGLGKTTLAAVVYNRISHLFDASSFLLYVSKFHKGNLVHLQEQLLCEILQEDLKIPEDDEEIHLIRTRLRHRKILIVLDDVNDVEQLKKLVGNLEWFGPGSRIIITTRHKQILREHGVVAVYKVEQLKHQEARQLLCRKAFNRDDPLSNFQGLTHRILQHAVGVPLALQVLGSYLCKRTESEWISFLEKLKNFPNQGIMGVLKISYDHLEEKHRALFLDIACFFMGEDEDYVTRILDYCGFNPVTGIRVLRDRSLIKIVNGKLWMHDILQEMGWNIVRGEFTEEPAKWSRLWLYKDLQSVKTGTEKVEAIVLKQEDWQETPLEAAVLAQMSRLKLIIFPYLKLSGNLHYLSNELRYLLWNKYPFTHLPSSFQPTNLVELIMPESNLIQLWEGKKNLPRLRNIDLRGSKNLIKTPILGGVENLEKLNLEECTGLLEVHPSVGLLKKLTFLNLRNCDHLNSIPSTLFLLASVETLNVSGCSNLAIF